MTLRPKIDMMEVTRLTREGRLMEAMALLRGTRTSSPPATVNHDTVQRPDATSPPLLTFEPLEIAGAASPNLIGGISAGPAHTVSQPRIRETLRGLLGRAGRLQSPRGFDGLAGRAAPPPILVPDGARFEERSYANGAGSRAYKLYVPSGYNGRALPLVVMLHGCTQSPDDFAAGTRMNDIAEDQTFLVAYPAQAPAANASKCWNWFNSADQQRDRGEPSLIAGITRQIMCDFPVAPGRIYVAGLSAGGAAAAIMGVTYPDLYAAVGVHSGLACGAARDVASAFTAMRQGGSAVGASRQPARVVPTIVFHGDRDATVNPVNADYVIAQAKAAANLRTCTRHGEASGGMSYTQSTFTDESGRPVLEHWVLHGGGHAWSGGSSAGSYTDPRGPDASREMVRFFLGDHRSHTHGHV